MVLDFAPGEDSGWDDDRPRRDDTVYVGVEEVEQTGMVSATLLGSSTGQRSRRCVRPGTGTAWRERAWKTECHGLIWCWKVTRGRGR